MARYKDAIKWMADQNSWGQFELITNDLDQEFAPVVQLTAKLFDKKEHQVLIDVLRRQELDSREEELIRIGEEEYEAELLDAGVTA